MPNFQNENHPASEPYLNPVFRFVKSVDDKEFAHADVLNKQPERTTLEKQSSDSLLALSNAINLAPEDSEKYFRPKEAHKFHLAETPFSSYLEQHHFVYRVPTGGGQIISMPGTHAVSPPYPPSEASLLQAVSRWLLYSHLSLPLAGIIALFCASIAAFLLIRFLLSDSGRAERAGLHRLSMMIALSWLSALSISYFFFSRL